MQENERKNANKELIYDNIIKSRNGQIKKILV